MKILVIGGTGGTGLQIVEQAIRRGIDVVAVVRSPEKLGYLRDQIHVIQASVFDADAVQDAAVGCDAALSSVGAPAGFLGRGATTVYSGAARALVTALPKAGVHRVIFCTSAGVEHDGGEPLPYRMLAKPLFLQRAYNDMIIAERVISDSELEWTLVRPSRLTDGPSTNSYRVSPRFRSPGGTKISRPDVASFMLDQVRDPVWVNATPTLSN